MAGLSNLAELEESITDLKARPDRKCLQIEALTDNVLSEGAEIDFRATRTKFLDLFKREQAHLSMPVSGMCIAHNAPIRLHRNLIHWLFLCSLRFAGADRQHLSSSIHDEFPPSLYFHCMPCR